MKAQPTQILERVLRPDQGSRRLVQPVKESGQQKAQGAAARQQRQRAQFGRGQRSYPAIAVEEQARFGHVEAAVVFEAPGIQADRQIVSEKIGAGEIEIDQTGNLALAK